MTVSVKRTSEKIITGAGAKTEIGKARAVYEWIVDNTFRDAQVRGCGIGDIAAMLRTGNLAGKCADLNALYVGLARAAGLPARDVYGIALRRRNSATRAGSVGITKAQHCRSEVYLAGFRWVARKTSIGWRTTSPTTSHCPDRAAQGSCAHLRVLRELKNAQ